MKPVKIFLLMTCIVLFGQFVIEEWLVLNNEKYSIKYPSTWKLDQSMQYMGSDFILKAPYESDADKFKENVTLYFLEGEDDLDANVERTEAYIKSELPNGMVLESKRVKTDSSEYHKLIYTEDKDGLKLKNEDYVILKDGNIYDLRFTTETAKFDKYKATGETILNSFKLKK